jgi:hypothetical protein
VRTSAAQLDPGLFLDEVLSVFALAPEADMLVVSTILLITSDVMLMVGCVACLGPARRALRIQPAEALRSVNRSRRPRIAALTAEQ